jgi:hypothetical protein
MSYKKGATPTPDHFWIDCGRDSMLNARKTIIAETRRCIYLAAAVAIVKTAEKAGRGRRARKGNLNSKKDTKESVG